MVWLRFMLWKISLFAEKFLIRETWSNLPWNCCEITKKNWKKLENWLTEKSKIDLCTLLWNSVNMKYMNILIVIFALINAQEGKLMDSCLVFLNGKTRTWNIHLRDHSTLSPLYLYALYNALVQYNLSEVHCKIFTP